MGFVLDHALFSDEPVRYGSNMLEGVTWLVRPVGMSRFQEIEEKAGMAFDDMLNLMGDKDPDAPVRSTAVQKALAVYGAEIEVVGWEGMKDSKGEEREFDEKTLNKLADHLPMLALEWMLAARNLLVEEGN